MYFNNSTLPKSFRNCLLPIVRHWNSQITSRLSYKIWTKAKIEHPKWSCHKNLLVLDMRSSSCPAQPSARHHPTQGRKSRKGPFLTYSSSQPKKQLQTAKITASDSQGRWWHITFPLGLPWLWGGAVDCSCSMQVGTLQQSNTADSWRWPWFKALQLLEIPCLSTWSNKKNGSFLLLTAMQNKIITW